MKTNISILLLEDSAADAGLIYSVLRGGGIAFSARQVETRSDFERELLRAPPDLILSDFSLPSFDGYTALTLAREKWPDTPFIFVTGTLGEEVAIETLKKGATDYVLKHRIARLVPSVHRALREAAERRERRRAEERLRQSNEQLRALSVHLQYVREEERIRIAREVHDELGQALTGLKLQLTWLTGRLPHDSETLNGKARQMAAGIDDVIRAIRRIATELRPDLLDTAGLEAAVEWQANEFEKQTGIRCRVKSAIRTKISSQDLNTAFFRIFQEALTNIIRHAAATKVEVRLAETPDQLSLEVRDNGRGILDAEINNTKSLGLLGMRERAALLGGEVVLSGRRGQGTTVRVSIPRPRKPGGAGGLNANANTSYRRSRRGAAGLKAHLA